MSDTMDFWEVAATLELDPPRLTRLARIFKYVPSDRVMSRSRVEAIAAEPDAERRYELVLAWFRQVR